MSDEKRVLLGPDGEPLRRRAAASAVGDTAHRGASSRSQELAQYIAPVGSADATYIPERDTLVARQRDIVRNDGWASGAIQRQQDAVIGCGLRLQSMPNWRALGVDPDWAAEWAEDVEAKWEEYTEDPRNWIDRTRQSSLSAISGTAFRHRILDGEAVAVLHWAKPHASRRYRTCIELIDPDRLANPMGQMDDELHRAGVELNSEGAAIAYHIRRTHPFDLGTVSFTPETVRVAREYPWGRPRVIHMFERERAGQHRGRGLLTPIVEALVMGSKYDRTEMQAAVLNAIYAAYIESHMDNEYIAEALGDGGSEIGAYQDKRAEFYEENAIRLNGSRIPKLFPGDKFTFQTAQRPASGHWPFMQSVLRKLAAATGMSYEQVSNDWSGVNYSSARAALIEVWRFLDARRFFFAKGLMTPVYMAWLEEAINIGDISLPDGAPSFYAAMSAYVRCKWLGPAREQVDPTKETQAAGERVALNLSTNTLETARMGHDYRDILQERARERRMEEDYGVPVARKEPTAGPVEHASDEEAKGKAT